MLNKEGNGIIQIIILHEEKHGVYDDISLSFDENNRSMPPPRCDVERPIRKQ